MILQKIRLENFRQFRGVQEICFEQKTPYITIIYGENGRGKTGIFRALMYGLFDTRHLAQDDDVNTKDINLVNTQALEANEGEPVIASVTVTLVAEGITYEIVRKLQGVKRNNQIAEQPLGVSLRIIDEHGNTKPPMTGAAEVGEIIGQVFDPKIKDYFLFDGEKIERLTRADSAQKRTVAQGIKNLLNINDLETARRAMEYLRSNLSKQIGKSSQGDLQKTLRAIEQNAKDIETNSGERNEIRENLECAQTQKKKMDAELDKISSIKHFIEERKKYIEEEVRIEEKQDRRIESLESKISSMAQTLLKKQFHEVYTELDGKKDAGEIPVQDKLELIKKVLSEQRCICGNCVKENSPAYKEIMSWKEKILDAGISDDALNIWRDLSTMLEFIPTTLNEVKNYLNDYETAKVRLNEIHEHLNSLSKNIDEGDEERAKNYNRLREKCSEDIGKYKDRANILDIDYKRLLHEKEDLIKRKERIISEEGIKSELLAAMNLATDSYEALDEIYNSFTADMKQKISSQASKIMAHLLDREGRYSLKSIVVKDDYSLQVNDHRDEPFLANISAGQRQIISLCFITALAQVASGSDCFEFPLFMDTPFGRLSFEHRNNLISFIPQICQQWITMVTDTELTQKEWVVYQAASCGCSFYKLASQKDGTTKIIRIPIENVAQTLA